uniref:Uncharacterized protein n=1 Tax=Oryza glumipatula TaxID=40148 RepID=A0A0D9YDP9_9ORYZ
MESTDRAPPTAMMWSSALASVTTAFSTARFPLSRREGRAKNTPHHPLNARLAPRIVVPFRRHCTLYRRRFRALNRRRGLPQPPPELPHPLRPEPTSSPSAGRSRRRSHPPPPETRSSPSAAAMATMAMVSPSTNQPIKFSWLKRDAGRNAAPLVGTGGIRNNRRPLDCEEPHQYAERCSVQWHRVCIYPDRLGRPAASRSSTSRLEFRVTIAEATQESLIEGDAKDGVSTSDSIHVSVSQYISQQGTMPTSQYKYQTKFKYQKEIRRWRLAPEMDFCQGLLRLGARAVTGEVSHAEAQDLGEGALLLVAPPARYRAIPSRVLVGGRSTSARSSFGGAPCRRRGIERGGTRYLDTEPGSSWGRILLALHVGFWLVVAAARSAASGEVSCAKARDTESGGVVDEVLGRRGNRVHCMGLGGKRNLY